MRIMYYMDQGGPIMWILLVLNFLSVSIAFWKYFSFREQRKNIQISAREILKNILQKTKIPPTQDIMLELAKDKCFTYVKSLNSGLGTIKMVASVSPLLGLLGTVLGVLAAFQTIAQTGLKNPTLFASGISMALITTVGGLVVAIPNLVFYNFLSGTLGKFEVDLEDEVTEVYLVNEYGGEE
jgi:biopolymer transport protein ExbB